MELSANVFEYFGPNILETDAISPDKSVTPISGPMTGYYMIDNSGSGKLENFTDICCELEFQEIFGTSPLRYSVIGNGDTEFGPFVMEGNYDSNTGILTLSRRYIMTTDPLAGKSIANLSAFHGKHVLVPWAVVAVGEFNNGTIKSPLSTAEVS